MTETIDGHLGFLRSDLGSGQALFRVLGVVRSSTKDAPEVEIRRVVASGPGTTELEPLDVKNGAIKLQQLNSDGTTGQGSAGLLKLKLAGTPDKVGSDFVWEFAISVSSRLTVPKGKSLDVVLSAHIASAEPLQELARLPVANLLPQLNSGSPTVLTLAANVVPRLSVGMNTATPKVSVSPYQPESGSAVTQGSGDATQPGANSSNLSAALYRVFVLLDNPNTFEPLWDSQTNERSIFSLSKSINARDPIRTAEESWARQVTEMLAFTPYGGPEGTYGISPESQFISEGLAASSPQYSITYACQQLATFALASRGITFAKLTGKKGKPLGELGLNAGSSTATTFTKQVPGGSWVTFSGETPTPVAAPSGSPAQLNGNVPTTAAAFFGAKIAPGSVFLFANRLPKADDAAGFSQGAGCISTDLGRGAVEFCTQTDKAGNTTPVISKINTAANTLVDNTANAHIGFVLRTDPRLQLFQTLDTGGLSVPNRSAGVSVFAGGSGFHTGNFDDPAGLSIKGGDPFRGMGVMPALTAANAPTLQSRVDQVLRGALPLGFVRFALINRSKNGSHVDFKAGNARQLILTNQLLYASPLLRMNGPGSNQNYAISRYLWSLRDFPAAATVEAWWFIYIPHAELAVATLAAARGDSVTTIVDDAFNRMSADRQKAFGGATVPRAADPQKMVRQLITPILNCTVTASGSALITATLRRTTIWHALHTLEAQATSSPTLPNLPRLDAFFSSALNGGPGLPSYFSG